jgi:hypothetical protein
MDNYCCPLLHQETATPTQNETRHLKSFLCYRCNEKQSLDECNLWPTDYNVWIITYEPMYSQMGSTIRSAGRISIYQVQTVCLICGESRNIHLSLANPKFRLIRTRCKKVVIRKICIYSDENWQNTIICTFINCPFLQNLLFSSDKVLNDRRRLQCPASAS